MLQLQHKNSNKGPLWLVESKYVIGCDEASDISLPKTSATDKYAELHVHGDEIDLVNISDDEAPKVNGVAVRTKQRLAAGDVIQLGDEELVLIDPKAMKREAASSSEATGDQQTDSKNKWAFKALNTALADKHYPLANSQTIGRASECDISLGVVHLSRKHAKVTVTDSGLLIEDLESSNGTYINAKKITRSTAIAGDEVSFDTLRFRVIGPVLDSNKTHVRTATDGDLTTIRPALNMAEHGIKEPSAGGAVRTRAAESKASQEKRGGVADAKSARPARTPPPRSNTESSAASEEQKTKNSTGLFVVLALVAAAAALGWYFLAGT